MVTLLLRSSFQLGRKGWHSPSILLEVTEVTSPKSIPIFVFS